MSELVEFDDLAQLRVLLRAAMVLKFDIPEASAGPLAGSPVFASAVHRLRNALVAALESTGSSAAARTEAGWYRLAEHPHQWELLARRASNHPRWAELDGKARRDWVETLAAPLVVDEESLTAIITRADGER